MTKNIFIWPNYIKKLKTFGKLLNSNVQKTKRDER